MTVAKWMVYWDEYAANTYLHGSKICFHAKDDVEFENLLMPSGAVIKEWFSKTNYQRQKIEPMLPIIDGESKYRITINLEHAVGENCLARLVFFDRYEAEAGTLILHDAVTEFQCPLKTYSYSLQLINAGVTHFHFHSITIEEIEDEDDAFACLEETE